MERTGDCWGPSLLAMAEGMKETAGLFRRPRLWKTTDDACYIPMHQLLPWKWAILTASQGSCYRELFQPEEIFCKAICSSLLCHGGVPMSPFFFLAGNAAAASMKSTPVMS